MNSEESDTLGVAEPTGAVTFGENPYEIMDAPIDETPVSPALPDLPPTVSTQQKGQYMRPSRKSNYSYLGNNNKLVAV